MKSPIPISIPGGQLTTSAAATVYSCPFGTDIRVDTILVVNTDTVTQTFNLYLSRFNSNSNQQITPRNVSLAPGALYELGPLVILSGDVIKGDASVNSKLDFTINGMQFVL